MEGASIICWIFIIIGLLMCFGGIFFRKFFTGLMTFCWSAILATLLVLLYGLSGDSNSGLVVFLGFLFVIICTIFAILYDRICVAINAFMLVFSLVLIISLFASGNRDHALVIIMAIIISMIPAIISYRFYFWAFILITAMGGAFLTCLGIYGLMGDTDAVEMALFWGYSDGLGSASSLILLGTVILGCLGVAVQYRKLREMMSGTTERVDLSSFGSRFENDKSGKITIDLNGILIGIKDEITTEKLLFVVWIIGFIIYPLFHRTSMGSYLGYYPHLVLEIFNILALASLIYLVFTEKTKTAAMWAIIYTILVMLCRYDHGRWLIKYIYLDILEALFIVIISMAIRKYITKDYKYFLSLLFLIIYHFLFMRTGFHNIQYWSLVTGDYWTIAILLIGFTIFMKIRIHKNIINKYIAVVIIILVTSVGGYKIYSLYNVYSNSAVANMANDGEITEEKQNMIDLITTGTWGLYEIHYDDDMESYVDPFTIFPSVDRRNRVKFDTDGSVTFIIGNTYELFGKYVVDDVYYQGYNVDSEERLCADISLYSDSTDEVVTLWYDNMLVYDRLIWRPEFDGIQYWIALIHYEDGE